MADLAQLPLLDRSHLVTGAEQFLVNPGRLLWQAHFSGTTGAPITCYRTPGSSVFELSVLERQWSWFGPQRRHPASTAALLRFRRITATGWTILCAAQIVGERTSEVTWCSLQ